MRGKWVLISVSVVLAAIAAGALSVLRKPPAQNASAAARTEPAPPPSEASLAGKIEAQHVVAVGVPVTGSIAEFMADAGQQVYEGEVLARVSNTSLESARDSATSAVEMAQARVSKAQSAVIAARLEASRARADAARARSNFDRAEKTYLRQQMLNREGATPRLVYERSQRDYEAADSEYRSLDQLARQADSRVDELLKEEDSTRRILEDKSKELEDANTSLQAAEVHSPVDGLVVARRGEAGKTLGPQEQNELFRIAVDLGLLQVIVNPEPPLLARIKPGDAALVVVADLPGEGLSGTVKEVKGSQVIVTFESPNPVIKPGMTAQVRIKF